MINFYIPVSQRDKVIDTLYNNYSGTDIVEFPEYRTSPLGQMQWVKTVANCKNQNIHIVTYSSYIINYLNVLIKEGTLNENNLSVKKIYGAIGYENEDNSLFWEESILKKNDNDELYVDTEYFDYFMKYIGWLISGENVLDNLIVDEQNIK